MRVHQKVFGYLVTLFFLCVSFAVPAQAMDVTLAWDANTEPELSGYKLHYGTEAGGGSYKGTGAAEGDSPIDVGNVTTFTLHGLPDGTVHFFVVTAYSDKGTQSDYSNEVDALAIKLSSGSNLISLYRQPSDVDITQVLEPISGKYTSVWAFGEDNWSVYDPANPAFSDLKEMEAGRGYWIDMKQPGTLPVFGSLPSNQISLSNGSNLVGYNAAAAREISNAIGSIENECGSVWTFVDGNWRVYDPANPAFSDLGGMEPGHGYWIDVSKACVWTLP